MNEQKAVPGGEMPAESPWLAGGAHRDASSGMCVMELASQLAGERFTDHPRCVDPTVASLCRLVNDTVTAASRQQMAGYLPQLMTTRNRDPRVDPLVVLACVTEAHQLSGSRALLRHRRRALRQLDYVVRSRPSWRRSTRCALYRAGASVHALALARLTAAEYGDEAVLGLLQAALEACAAVDPVTTGVQRGRSAGGAASGMPRRLTPAP